MKRVIFITAAAVLLAAVLIISYSTKKQSVTSVPPAFETYKVDTVFTGIPVAPDFGSRKDALQHKTAITEAAKKGPNFAGAYTVVSWGCGTACQGNAILDARTGKVVIFGNDYISTRGLKFEKDSSLIIFDPYDPAFNLDNDSYNFPARYFVFENGALREVYKEGCVTVSSKRECGELFYGFIRSFSAGRLSISIDAAEFLSGTEAREKASQDTGCPAAKVEECVPSLNNDFYIRNLDKTATVFPLVKNILIKAEANQGSPELALFSPSTFERAYSDIKVLPQSLFRFIKRGTSILYIEQQYTP